MDVVKPILFALALMAALPLAHEVASSAAQPQIVAGNTW